MGITIYILILAGSVLPIVAGALFLWLTLRFVRAVETIAAKVGR